MPDSELKRGQIGDVAKATQWRDYSGLRFERNITPTDIDGSVDFDGELFVMLEHKSKGAPMSYGQRLHLESITKAINSGGKNAACLICEHDTPTDQPINGADAKVVEYLWWGNQKWMRPHLSISTYNAILKLKELHAKGLEAVQ
jgi:hypothetical protein